MNIESLLNHRHLNIFVFIWSFIFGVFFSSITNIRPLTAVLFFIIALGIYFAEKVWNKSVSKLIFIIFLFLISFGLGVIRLDIKDFHEPSQFFESAVDSKIGLSGVVVSEPEIREKNMRFIVLTPSVNEKVLVSTNLYTDIKYGDEINFSGKLARPGLIEMSDSGREFDYGAYLSKDDIYYTMSFAQIETVERDRGNPIMAFLLKIKGSFVNRMKKILPEPKASLLAGLLVSGKQALPASILDEFKSAGVVHIVVLSGYNIMIVAEFLRRVFGYFSLKLASSFSILGVVLFVLMTGASATIVRAGIMALIAVSGKMFGRSYSASRALLVAGFLMLLQNPKILVFDSSFQLSMLATIAMIYVSPVVERLLPRVASAKWGLGTILVSTISTQIFVLPYLLHSMGSVSIVSLFSNILILAFVPYTMLLGFISTLIAYIAHWLALPFTLITNILLSWILGVAHFFGNLSWASIKISSFPIGAMILVYLIGMLWLGSRTFLYKSHQEQ